MVKLPLLASKPIQKAATDIWWMGVIQGTLAIFFGIVAIFWPGLTLVTLVYIFSAFIIAIGIVETVEGLTHIARRSTWWLTLLLGIIALGVGVYLVRNPGLSLQAFIMIVGILLIARGLIMAMRALVDKPVASNNALTTIGALASVLAGIILLLQPVAGGIAFVWVLGLYALIIGALSITVAFAVRDHVLQLIDKKE